MSTTVTKDPPEQDSFATAVARLSNLSAGRGFDAFRDVEWDHPDFAVEPDDPRLRLPLIDPLADTEWYKAEPPEVQGRVGMYRLASCLKIGWQFENLLQQGLLHRVLGFGPAEPEFRYAHHELIEESQHTLMFYELVGRSGLRVPGMPWVVRRAVEVGVGTVSRYFPPLFFILVLGGEEPIDHVQRRMLQDGIEHPLIERIIRIHVTEEARHVSFARKALERDVPKLDPVRFHVLAVAAPVVFGYMSRLMLYPPRTVVRRLGVPPAEVRAAKRSRGARQILKDSVAKPRRHLTQLGLMTPPAKLLWRAVGLWDDDAAPSDRVPREVSAPLG